MAPTQAALLLLGLTALTVAGPVNVRYSQTCSRFCPENTKFGFETGKTYEYGYESIVKTHIPGASSDHSSLEMHAVAKVEVISRCEMALRLESVDLKDMAPGSETAMRAERSREFATALERHALRFGFVSGNVESVCPSTQEETWTLNIKRAILSHLQNTMNDFNTDFRSRETDVTGDCPVTYHTESADWSGVHTIKKTKDMDVCTGRMSADTVLQGTAYKTPSKMQSLPMMKGTHECRQKINKQSLLIESTCTESHLFRPFSRGSKGATTDITTKMTYKQTTAGVLSDAVCGEPKPITFDHEKTPEELISIKTEATRVLREMCAQTPHGVSAGAPSMFGELIRELKKLDTASLISLHADLSTTKLCDHAEKYLHDAIPNIGTVGSARLIKNLILSGEVTGAESAIWLNSLAFVQKPSAAMLSEVTPLVSTSPLNRQAALAVSSLVNNFCRDTPSCSTRSEVTAITTALEAHLARGCEKTTRQHDEVITALKALGNTGHADAEVLNACIRNNAIDIETRVVATNAFRRMECSADRSELARIFENAEIDSELRIGAYLSLMACPTTDVLFRVRNILEREEVNQVGSFVWTHLTNLMETASPLKQEIRQIVEQESLRKDFNIDKRKFSRNIEKSYFSDVLNSGASMESNIIWSPDSFVPRSASLNLTTDLFGHSVNLVEIGGRVEGLNGILDNLFDTHAPAGENKETTRDINRVDKKFGAKTESNPKGSAYVRVFGNEIAYTDFHDLDASTVREKFNYLNWLIELAKEHTIDFSKSFQYLDTTATVATISGFPLNMHVEGNGVTDIKLKGKMDLRNLATSPRSVIINGNIAPSAALEITAEMGVDAFATKTGIRTVDTLHTSTEADGSIQLRDGKIFAMDIKMARNQMEIFSAKHDLFVVYRGRTRAMNMPAPRFVHSSCLSGKFTTITGLELCADIAVPNTLSAAEGPFIPFSSPGHVAFVLHKRDTFTSYHFEAKALSDKVAHGPHMDRVDMALISFNTPGSTTKREFTLDVSLNHSAKKVELSLITPWMPRASFTGDLTNTDELKQADAAVSIGSTVYNALAEVRIAKNKYNTRFLPKFELRLPSGARPTVSGELLYREGRKMDVTLNAQGIFSEEVTVDGAVTFAKEAKKIRYDTTLNIKSPLLKGKIEGYADRSETDGIVYSSRLEIAYKPSGATNNRIAFSGKLRDKNTPRRKDMAGSVAFTSTRWPDYDTDIKMRVQQQGKTLTTSFEGSLAGSASKTLKIQQNGLLNWGTYMKKANLEISAELPHMDLDHKIILSHMSKRDTLKSSARMTKGALDVALLDIDMSRESTSPLKAGADIKLHYPGRQMRFQQSIEEESTKNYRNELSLQLAQDQVIRLTADYKMLPRHEIEAQLTTPFIPPIKFIGHLNPVLNNFDAKASLEHKDNTYGIETTMLLRNNQKRLTLRLDHPIRVITSEAQIKRVGKIISGTFETKWDANRNADKKIRIDGEVTLAKLRPKLDIKGEMFPGRFIQIITEGDFTSQTGVKNHNGDLTLRSSFANFEEITISFKNKVTTSEITASGQVSWAPERKIDGDFTLNLRNGWTSVDANAKLLTPFTAVKRITYELDYAIEGSTFRAKTKGTFNDNNLGFVVSGVAANPTIEGSITMTSTIPGFRKIVLKASHVDTGRKCHSEAELAWGSNNKVAVIYNMVHGRTGYHLNNNGAFQLKTTFKGYRNTKITWNHINDETSVKQHFEIEMFKKTGTFDFEGSIVASGNTRKFNVDTSLTAPKINWKLSAKHHHNIDNNQDISTSALIQWAANKRIKITNEFGMDSGNLQESLKFLSPFEDFETISLEMDNKYTPVLMTASNELKWPGNNNAISLTGKMERKGNEFDASFEIATPFMATQKMTMVNKIEGTKYIAQKTYEYAPEKVISTKTTYDDATTKTYTMDFTSPWYYMEAVNFKVESTGSPRDFTVKSEFFHNLMTDKIELATRLDSSDLSDLKATFNLKTPIDSISEISATYSHKIENGIKISSGFRMPSYRGTFNHEMTRNNGRFTSDTTLMYKPRQKIQVTMNFDMSTTISGDITLKSPFVDDIALQFSHEGPINDMKNTFEATFEKTKKVSASLQFNNRDGIFSQGELSTPWMGYKNLGFRVKYDGPITNMKVDWSMNLEESRMSGQHTFALVNGHLEIKNAIRTPIAGYDKFIFNYENEGTLSKFSCSGLIEYTGGKFELKTNFDITGNDVTLKSEIHTPFEIMRAIILDLTHEGQLKDFTNSLLITLNGNRYQAKSEFKYSSNGVRGSATVLLNGEEYSITFRHSGAMTNFNNNLVVKFNSEQLTWESKYRYQGNNIEGSFKIETPFEGYKKLSFNGNHHGPLTNFNCDYTIEVGSKTLTISDEFKLIGDAGLIAKLDISMPFDDIKNINVHLKHDGPISSFKNDGFVKINTQKYVFRSQFDMNSDSINGNALLTIPEEYSLMFRHQGSYNDFNNAFELKADNSIIKAASNFKWDDAMEFSATLNTPFNEPLALRSTFTGDWAKFGQELNLELGDSTYLSKAIFEKTSNGIKFDYELNTPFEAVRSVVINADHSGKSFKNFRNNIDFIHNGLKRSAGTDFKWFSNLFKLKATANIPEDYMLLLKHKQNNKGFETELKITTPTSSIDGSCNFEITDTAITGTFALRTPFSNLRSQSLTFTHNPTSSGFSSKLNIQTSIDSFKSLEASLSHEGDYKRFTTTGSISLESSQMSFSVNHNTQPSGFSSRASVTFNSQTMSAEITLVKATNKITLTGSIDTPFTGFEKMSMNFDHEGPISDFTSKAEMKLNDETISGEVTYKKTGSQIASTGSITTPFTGFEKLTFNIDHTGDIAEFRTSYSMAKNNDAISSIVEFKKDDNELTSSIEINTPFTSFEKLTFSMEHKGHLNDFTSTASIAKNTKVISYNLRFKKEDHKIESSITINTPFRGSEEMTFAFEAETTEITSTAAVTINGQRASVEFTLQKEANKIMSSGSVTTPFTGYERFNYIFNINGRLNSFATSCLIGTPFGNVKINYNHKGNMKNFECDGSVDIDGQKYEGDLIFKLLEDSLDTAVTISTPHRKYDNFAVNMKHERLPRGIKSSIDVRTPFEGFNHQGAALQHEGVFKDFHTTANVYGLRHPITFELNHRGEWHDFNTNGHLEFNNERHTASQVFKYDNGNVDVTGSLTVIDSSFRYNLKHSNTARGFSTEGSVETPFDDYKTASFELTHEGPLSNFVTHGKINPFHGEGSFRITHRGTINDIISTINAEWNTMTITGTAAYKNEEGNMEASSTLTTPFSGFERFHIEAKHKQEGNKIKTEASIETPFRGIRDPSFVFEHRGHWKNFRTSFVLTPTCKKIQPMRMIFTHRGNLKDFQSTATFKYGIKTMTANAQYKKTPNGLTAQAEINTPFENAEKFGFNIEHSYDGKDLNTKGSIVTPHQVYRDFGIEVSHSGDLRKFETRGKIESPFSEPINFEVNHEGILRDFQSRASIQHAGEMIQGEARYKKERQSHNGHISIRTPFTRLRRAEATLSHTQQGSRQVDGNLKGFFNKHQFDGDYSFTNEDTKSGRLTLRHPRAMEYTASVTPSEGTAEAFINWDSTSSLKQMRIEGTLKNVADRTKTDRQVTVKVTTPGSVKILTTGYQMENDKFSALLDLVSDSSKFHQEIELEKTERGRDTIYDGKLTITSPVINFVMSGEHTINPGRRYLTEINIGTSEKLQLRSDIHTRKGLADYMSSFIISHPSFTKQVQIDVNGKIDTENNNYEGLIDLDYAEEKITFTGKITDGSNRYRTLYNAESSLKHLSNNVDMAFKGSFLNNKKFVKIDSDFNYLMSATKRKSIMAGTFELNKITEDIKIRVNNPMTRFDINGKRTINEASRQHFSITGSIDGEAMGAEVEVDRTIPSVSASLNYATERTLHMYAKYVSQDHFQMKAYRQISGDKNPEFEFDTEIVAGHLVKSRVFLRPGAMSDFSEMFSIDSGLGQLYGEVTQAIATDLRLKAPGFKKALKPLIDSAEYASQRLGVVAQRVERFVSSNQFYTRDIANAISGFFTTIRSTVDEAIIATVNAITNAQRYYGEVAATYDQWRQDTMVQYNQMYQQAAAKMTEARNKLHEILATYVTDMHGSLLDVFEAIRNCPRVQTVMNHLQAKAERIIERVTQLADHLTDAAESFYNRPELAPIRNFITTKAQWIFEFVNLEVKAREWLHSMKDAGLTPIRNAVWKTMREMLHLDETRMNIWAPERGEISGQVYIPLLMRDLRSMPTMNVRGFVDKLKSHIPDTDWVFWDTLYAYKPSSDIRDWIPPFKSHATIAGNQHYMTFDKKFYEFAGECSYLLARDFIDGTFSVLVNYEKRNNVATKKSISIVHGTDTVEILPDFRVEVNGRRSELPVISQHSAVYRVGNTLRIDNNHGVKIMCNLPHDHCTVAVTGWYFGKTAGLLGTYDNEPSTDFTMINGRRAESVGQFAKTWAVGKQCRAVNHARNEEISPIHSNYQQCADIFQSQTSSFRPCFKQMDPTPFMQMCINGDPCKVSSAYVTECKLLEVPVRMPRQCVTCQLPSGTPLSEGQEQTIRDSEVPKKADVVFVVSKGECNTEAIQKMQLVANQVLISMKGQGINDVHFGLVGYGGEGMESRPHSHTMDGHLLNSKTTFLQTISRFSTLTSNNEEDSLEAVQFASRYAFRGGASKSIILMPCSKCSTKNVPYSSIQTSLSDQDIKFHMFIQEDFRLNAYSKSPKTSYMYGIDREHVFTAKDARGREVRGDRDLRRHTVAPKDLCVALTHETDGTVFNLRKLTETSSDKQKRFATVFGRVIAMKGKPADCQRCECRSDESGVGVTVCHPCVPATPYVYTWDQASLPEPEVPFSKSRAM